jgi:hypothetical protein
VIVPPKGYLQKLRDICTKHGILLIFDEVITGFWVVWALRVGADHVGVTAGSNHLRQGGQQRRCAVGRPSSRAMPFMRPS